MIVSNIIDITKEKFRLKSYLNIRMLKTLFIILCGFQLYMYYTLSSQTKFFLSSFSVLLLFIFSYKEIFRRVRNKFYSGMQWILFSWIFCMFMAWIFWGQGFGYSYRASSYFLFIIFFYFVANKFKVSEIERLIVVLGWLYVVLWLYAVYRVPEATFGYNLDEEIDDESRGFFRINFTGRLSLIFAYFLYVCKYFTYKKKSYLVYAAILFTFLVFQLTRQLILWTAVVTLLYIFKTNKKWSLILAVAFTILYLGSAQIEFSNDSIIGSMINMTNDQMNGQLYAGEDPRITEYRYFFTQWSPNFITDIFGTGIPFGGGTAYGDYEQKLKWTKGIYLSDIGYGQMFALTGALGLFLYIWLFVKCTFVKMPKELQYVNMFMGAMLPLNIAAAWYAGGDSQICIAICVYLIVLYRKKSKRYKKTVEEKKTL